MSLTEAEKKLNEKAHKLDDAYKREELAALRKTCKHRFVGSWDIFDRCEICGQPGEQIDICLPTEL